MKRYAQVVKDEVLGKVSDGRKVMEVSKDHSISEMTVRTWLTRDTDAGAALISETSRLRRETEALLRLVGQLTYESDVQKKISAVLVTERGNKPQVARELGAGRASFTERAFPAVAYFPTKTRRFIVCN